MGSSTPFILRGLKYTNTPTLGSESGVEVIYAVCIFTALLSVVSSMMV